MGRLVVLVGAALILTSCGAAQADPLAAAAARTRDSGTSAIEVRIAYGDDTGSITGEFDYDKLTGELRFEFSEELGIFTIRYADDGATYLGYPSSSSVRSDELLEDLAGKWVRIDEGWSPFGVEEILASLVPLPGLSSPHEVIELLEFARGDVTEEGGATLRGTPTTHYRALLDVRRLLKERAGAADEELVEDFEKIDELPLDVWIDDRGRVRKVGLSFPALEDEPAATVTVELFAFGRIVSAPKPSADQLVPDVPGG
jgi:hypothetical protein